MVFPLDGKLYGLILTEQRDWEKKFRRHVPSSNFNYWDNTDPDSKVSDIEWKARAAVWNQYDDALKLVVDCSVDPYNDVTEPSKHEIVKAIASRKERALRVANDRAYLRFSEMDEKYQAAKRDAETRFEDVAIPTLVGLVMRFRDWTKTEAAQCMIALEAGHVRSSLPEITVDMI